jgi:RHS repeat-associated protein
VWIDEKSTVFRTPYQFGGGYVDEVRDIVNFGARFYDQNREVFYAPDPVLTDDPAALLDKPALTAAYAYAGSNPLANVDPSGREFYTSQTRGNLEAKHAEVRAFIGRNPAVAAAIVANLDTRLPRGLVALGLNTKRADRIKAFSKALEAKPIVEIDPNKGTVKLSLGIGKRLRIPKNTPAALGPNGNNASAQDATGSGGRPAIGAGGAGGAGATGATSPQAPAPPAAKDTGSTAAAGPGQTSDATATPRRRANSAPAALTGGGIRRADE